jgi:PHS family inorganic phosphate transporter-like MFS transporter
MKEKSGNDFKYSTLFSQNGATKTISLDEKTKNVNNLETTTTTDENSFNLSKVIISGVGFLADAYDLFVINVVVDLMSKENYHQPLTNATKATIKAMALIGAIIGQLVFGATADLIGRRRVFIATCSMVIIGALMSSTIANTRGEFGIYSQLIFWRFFLGVGVGGEYPLSASITSESSGDLDRGRNLSMVFSMQGVGTILCSLVLVTVTASLGENYNAQWRIALAIGGH